MFILPTKELEGFGLVTVEALASGLPVLGTPIGGTREILSQLNPEFLFEDCEADAMEKVIKKWVEQFKNNPDLYKEISTKCRNFAEIHYSWEDKIVQLEEEFRTA
jgi:glycosyltransferase involved in cell wall biosynthesis